VNAVNFFCSAYGYYLETEGSSTAQRAQDRLVPDGWYTPAAGEHEVVRVRADLRDGKPVYRIAVSDRWAALAPDALAVLVNYALTLEMELRLHPGRSSRDPQAMQLRALGIVAF